MWMEDKMEVRRIMSFKASHRLITKILNVTDIQVKLLWRVQQHNLRHYIDGNCRLLALVNNVKLVKNSTKQTTN